MGSSSRRVGISSRTAKMKLLVLLFIAAAFAEPAPEGNADPEAGADPAAWYYSGYYGHPYSYYGYRAYSPYYYGGYYGYPYTYGYRYWKRDAEQPAAPAAPQYKKRAAEDEPAAAATAPLLYSGYYPYAYHYPYHTGYTYTYPVATHVVKPYSYYANSGGAVHIVKREAAEEAGPKADADPAAWYGGYYGYPYSYGGYYGYPYHHRGYYGYYGWGK